MSAAAPRQMTPWRWALVLGGLALGGCCLFSVLGAGLVAAMGDAAESPAPATATARAWKPAGEVARGTSFTRSLEGRWLYQSGGSVDSIVARSGATAWVQTNSSGTLYDFTFQSDGSFLFQWASAVTLFGGTSRSSCVEKGSWSLSGSQLTLAPDGQRCTYVSNTGLSQDKEDTDLTPRRYDLTDIELETIAATGAAPERFGGLELRGPAAAWDVSRQQLELDLQPL